MRVALIAAALILLPIDGHAQSRPAPGTPGVADIIESHQPDGGRHLADALRVLVITAGIIGGFVAADIISGGTLTAPLLSGAEAATGVAARAGRSTLAPGAGLRPVIAPALSSPPTAATLPALRQTIGQALTRRP